MSSSRPSPNCDQMFATAQQMAPPRPLITTHHGTLFYHTSPVILQAITKHNIQINWDDAIFVCKLSLTVDKADKVFKIVLVSRFLRKSIYYEYFAAGYRIQRLQCQMPIRPLCQGLLNVSCTNLMSNARVIKEESCLCNVCSLRYRYLAPAL